MWPVLRDEPASQRPACPVGSTRNGTQVPPRLVQELDPVVSTRVRGASATCPQEIHNLSLC